MFLYFNFSDRNGLYAKQTSLFVIVTQHSNSHVLEALEIIFFIGYVVSSVVNMTSEKYNVSEVSIFLKSTVKPLYNEQSRDPTNCSLYRGVHPRESPRFSSSRFILECYSQHQQKYQTD